MAASLASAKRLIEEHDVLVFKHLMCGAQDVSTQDVSTQRWFERAALCLAIVREASRHRDASFLERAIAQRDDRGEFTMAHLMASDRAFQSAFESIAANCAPSLCSCAQLWEDRGNAFNETPLGMALKNDAEAMPVAQAMVRSFAIDLNAPVGSEDDLYLHRAIQKANPELVALLLEKGADPSLKGGRHERNALHVACSMSHHPRAPKTLDVLIRHSDHEILETMDREKDAGDQLPRQLANGDLRLEKILDRILPITVTCRA